MVVASAARRARYWPTVMPPMSVSAGRKVFSVTGVATFPIRIKAGSGVENDLMDLFEKMLGFEKIRHPIKRVVIDQDRAQQALFRLDIVGCAAIGRSWRIGGELENVRISRAMGSDCSLCLCGCCRMRGGDKAPAVVPAEARTCLMPDSHNARCESWRSHALSLDGFLRGNLAVLGRFSSKNTADAKLTSQALNLSRRRPHPTQRQIAARAAISKS